MVEAITSDSWFETGQQHDREAQVILKDTKNLTAERYEEAMRLIEAGQKAYDKSEGLQTLEAKRHQAMQHAKNEGGGSDEDAELEEARKKASGFKSVGHWGLALYHLKANKAVHGALKYWDGDGEGKVRAIDIKDAKALAENTGATGGFLVPPEFQARVLAVAQEQTIVRPRAEIIRMNRRTVTIPALDQEGVVEGGFSWYGGIRTFWAEEGSARQASQPNFRDVTLTAHALTGYTSSSNELLDDSAVSLQDWLMGQRGFAGALAHQFDYDCLQGDGVGKPQGVLSAPCTIVVPRATANVVGYEDLADMMGSMLPNTSTVWVASQSVLPELLKMQGPSGNPYYLWGSAISGAPNTLLGRPIIFSDKVPGLGTQGDIGLYDFGYYLIGDRQAITMDMSVEELFRNNQVSWRAIMRVDGRPWLKAPISYGRGEEIGTLSPFVVLGDVAT